MSRYNYCDTTDRIYFKKDAQTAKELIIVEDACDRLNDLERQLEEATEDVKTYKYDLETLVSIVTECVYDMSEEERYDTLKEVADHYKQLKEKDDE